MKLAVALSAFTASEPASNRRNIDHGPVRSMMDGGDRSSTAAVITARVEAPGHCTVTGSSLDAGVTIDDPPTSNLTLVPGPVSVGGVMASETMGALPPPWKKASRISAARWKSRSVVGDSAGSTPLLWRQVQCSPEVSA